MHRSGTKGQVGAGLPQVQSSQMHLYMLLAAQKMRYEACVL